MTEQTFPADDYAAYLDELEALSGQATGTNSVYSVFSPVFVPGIAQNEEYARTVFEQPGPPLDPAWKVDTRLQARRRTWRVLARSSAEKLHIEVFITEGTLRGGRSDQRVALLQYLLWLGERHSSLSLRVIPAGVGSFAGSETGFSVMQTGLGQSSVYITAPDPYWPCLAEQRLEGPSDPRFQRYLDVLAYLRGGYGGDPSPALSREESARFIAGLIRNLTTDQRVS